MYLIIVIIILKLFTNINNKTVSDKIQNVICKYLAEVYFKMRI
jgi:hypothetical protein